MTDADIRCDYLELKRNYEMNKTLTDPHPTTDDVTADAS